MWKGCDVARGIHRLKAVQIRGAAPGSKLGDGGGLWLFVAPTGARSWVFRYRLHGRDREMGLGAFPDVGLAEARDLAAKCRALKREGIDPLEHRARERQRSMAAGGKTFRDCVEAVWLAHRAGWTNSKHAAQWRASLEQHVYEELGDLPVQDIDTAAVQRALERVWRTTPVTASRVRQRVESVLDWAAACGYRTGENPARWRGHLDKLLPRPAKLRRVKHHPALPWQEIGTFMAALRQRPGLAARALEFTILTAARSGEVLGATWAEVDLTAQTWTVPAERMKGRREHRIPLSRQACALLRALPRAGDLIFPGARRGKPLSGAAMLRVLQRMGRGDLTVHGFRSAFRDWCSEQARCPREVAEAALAHALRDQTEAAYRRGDMLARRARLMQDWADWCGRIERADVTPIRSHGGK